MIINDDSNQEVKAPEVKASKQPAAGVVPATANPLQGVSPEAIASLIQAMLLRESRAAKIEEEEFARKEARRLQYAANRTDDEKTVLLRQATCRHLKGGRNRRRNAALDYAVYMHTFITGETYIKCQTCGMKWRPTDTDEFVVRNGKVYKNHTKKGWAAALELAAQSTNSASRSEIPPSQFANVPKEVAMPNPMSVEIDTNPIGEAEPVNI